MSDLNVDSNLLEEVRHRLTLRDPNALAVESVVNVISQHYDVDQGESPLEMIVDSATGVGKTYIMAGIVEYLAGTDDPARNFLLLAPGRTIRDKSVNNFTPGHPKSITAFLRSDPYVITKDNFKSPATHAVMKDRGRTKLYIFTVQALTSRTGDGRETHEYQETLAGSFYEFLTGLDDLVILADEHHCYRGPAFSRTILNLDPEVVVGVTATPDRRDENLVIFRYPLAAAIEDKYVKMPVLVARQDDRHDDRTKLLDGVLLLQAKAQVARAFCSENEFQMINPVMLVIAENIQRAEEFRDMFESDSFDGGRWRGSTLLVHSDLSGDAKEDTLASLDAVEDPRSPVRIIIAVGMLKEGWDVKNVYVIASMRPSISDVLTEQTLGRGMRLPFGAYTDDQMLDTVEVLAHERYEDLLRRRQSLNESFVDHRIYFAARETSDGRTVARKQTAEVPITIESIAPAASDETVETTEELVPAAAVQSFEDRVREAQARAEEASSDLRWHSPILDRPPIQIPYVDRVPQPRAVSLNQVHDMAPFTRLGEALTTEADTTLRRTVLEAEDGRITARRADDLVQATIVDFPLEELKRSLVESVMRVRGVERRAGEVAAAKAIVQTVIDVMGEDAQAHLSAFLERAARRLQDEVSRQLRRFSASDVTFSEEVHIANLEKVRKAQRLHEHSHEGSFKRGVAFNDWKKNLYEYAWFDTSPEFKAAKAVDDDPNVVVWARLHRGDIPITWTIEGREYNPDLVVIEELDDQRTCWLVETKMNREMTSTEVMAKRRAATTWSNTVNNSGKADGRWRYLLLSEDDVDDAAGSWTHMKGFGR
jgi:type III restriction enzyme